MAPDDRSIWAFSENQNLLAELLAGAHMLAQQTGGMVTALVLGPRPQVQQAFSHGAQRVIWLGEQQQGYLVDDYVPTLAGLVEEAAPYAVLVGATRRGRAVAGRLAARLGTTALTDVLEFSFEGENVQARHMIFGGGAVRIERPLAQPVVATLGPGVFEAQPAGAEREGEMIEAAFVAPERRAVLRERKPRKVAAVNLPAAKRVVCAGRGLASQEDLDLVVELARTLGAELACTRPLAEGLGWLPRERYIGISGATVKPDLYLGVGVSGQAQHAIGMSDSRVVVAINKDQNAPIFSQADYAIPDDLYTILPALIRALKLRR
jgi:electron transfer flavoprotein alpha subunit